MHPKSSTYLWDVREAGKLIQQFSTSRSMADYFADALLRSAVERQFEIIGEALNQLRKIDEATANQIPEIRRIVAFRNIPASLSALQSRFR